AARRRPVLGRPRRRRHPDPHPPRRGEPEQCRVRGHPGAPGRRRGGHRGRAARAPPRPRPARPRARPACRLHGAPSGSRRARTTAAAALAWQLEERYTKERILELYLNTVYFGAGAYGVVAAAHEFFGKPLAELTLAESALLAGLINSPGSYDVRNRPEPAL